MRTLKKIVSATLLLLTINTFARAEFNNTVDSGIVISGVLLDSGILNTDYVSTIAIILSETPFPFVELSNSPHKKYTLKCKGTDTFKIRVPKVAKINYMYISYSTPNLSAASMVKTGWIDNVYLINSGDSIFCKLKVDKRIFSGLGAEKLQCQQELYVLKYQNSKRILKLLEDEKTFLKGLQMIDKESDSVFKLQLAVINNYNTTLNISLINTMKANCVGYRYYSFLRRLSSENVRAKLKLLYGSNFYNKIDKHFSNKDDVELARSSIYASVLLQKIMIEASLSNDNQVMKSKGKVYLDSCYKTIKKRYTGVLKDKLITLLLSRGKTSGLRYIEHVLNEIKDPLYYKTLTTMYMAKKKGNNFSQYKLTNISGDKVSLSEFNNKVVLIDFWYTGCMPCIFMNKSLEPIYEKLKNNPKIAFVSVNIDPNLKRWEQSVETGKYTSSYGIHLNTGVFGSLHPIIRENLITSYPTFYILKNGKLYTSIPPIPKNPADSVGISELMDVIEEAINDSSSF